MSEGEVTKWELVRRFRSKNKVEPETVPTDRKKRVSWSKGVS